MFKHNNIKKFRFYCLFELLIKVCLFDDILSVYDWDSFHILANCSPTQQSILNASVSILSFESCMQWHSNISYVYVSTIVDHAKRKSSKKGDEETQRKKKKVKPNPATESTPSKLVAYESLR